MSRETKQKTLSRVSRPKAADTLDKSDTSSPTSLETHVLDHPRKFSHFLHERSRSVFQLFPRDGQTSRFRIRTIRHIHRLPIKLKNQWETLHSIFQNSNWRSVFSSFLLYYIRLVASLLDFGASLQSPITNLRNDSLQLSVYVYIASDRRMEQLGGKNGNIP